MRAFFVVAALVFSLGATPSLAAEPVVGIWYRGTPAGTPRIDELAAIRAAGFGTVAWPSGDDDRVALVKRMAESVGLVVMVQPDDRARPPRENRTDVDVSLTRPEEISALVWRAIARGVRTITFDPGPVQGSGLDGEGGQWRGWVRPAVAVARQLAANAPLIGEIQRASSLRFLSLRPVTVDVELFEGSRAWVVIATNAGQDRARTEVALPRGVPYAIWVSLLDESTLAMLDRPDGARWRLEIDAGAALVYVIDKVGPG